MCARFQVAFLFAVAGPVASLGAPAANASVANAAKPAALLSSTVAAAPAGAKIAPFGKEDTAKELQQHAARTQDTLVDAVENAEVAEIKEFDTIARLETQAIDEYNDAHHYRAENPLSYIHSDEPKVAEDKFTSFH